MKRFGIRWASFVLFSCALAIRTPSSGVSAEASVPKSEFPDFAYVVAGHLASWVQRLADVLSDDGLDGHRRVAPLPASLCQDPPQVAPQIMLERTTGETRQFRYMKFWACALPTYLAIVIAFWLLGKRHLNAEVPEKDNDPDKALLARIISKMISMLVRVGDPHGLEFKNKILEAKWLRESDTRMLKLGIKMISMLAACGILYLIVRESEIPSCIPKSRNSQVMTVVLKTCGALCMLGSLVTSVVLARSDSVRPEAYWKIAILFFAVLPAMHCPPFQFTADRFQWACQLELASRIDPLVNLQVEYSDFSMLGLSATLVQMSWLICLPWILPRYPMMLYVWMWLFGVYVCWGLYYFAIFPAPVVDKVDDLRSTCDVFARTALLVITWVVSTGKKWYLERAERNRFASSLREFHSTKKLYTVLAVMVPEYVILRMLKGDEAIADPFPCVSILFSEIQDFEKFTLSKSPKELLDFLNAIFDKFDAICMREGVTKIETWGHEYVACVGTVPEHVEEAAHGHRVLLERLLRAGATMLSLQDHHEVEFRMGVHTGPIVAGVIGNKLPRYRLFGDTINTAARQMQRSQAGELQFGEETKIVLEGSVIGWKDRGFVEMKGKGNVKAYLLDQKTALPPQAEKKWSRMSLKVGTGLATRLCATHASRSEAQASIVPQQDSDVSSEGPEYGDSFADLGKEEINDDIEGESDEKAATLKGIIDEIMAKGDDTQHHWFVSERAGFTPDLEVQWFKSYHVDDFCKKMVPRMGRHSLMLVAVSVGEAIYMRHMAQVWSADLLRVHLPCYLWARGSAILVLLIVWHIAGASTWIQKNPLQSQTCILLTTALASILLGVSYREFSLMHTLPTMDENNHLSREWVRDLLAFDQCFVLLYVLLFYLLSMSHQFLFYPSLVFPFLCLGLMIYEKSTSVHQLLPLRGKILFFFNAVVSSVLAHNSEQESRARFKANQARAKTLDKTQKILETLMPPLVVDQIRELHDADLPTHFYRHATFAQSDLCGFTQLAATKTPPQVVELVQDLFGRFDRASTKRGIYKVETVGDAYIAGMAEKPLTASNSPADVVLFGLDMVREVEDWSESIGAKVKCRVGVHSGDCIGGIVGNDMQRYHIFGKMMLYIEILESTGVESMVQVSVACKEEVERQLAEHEKNSQIFHQIEGFERRTGPQLTTSKGGVHSYDEVGGQTFFVKFRNAV